MSNKYTIYYDHEKNCYAYCLAVNFRAKQIAARYDERPVPSFVGRYLLSEEDIIKEVNFLNNRPAETQSRSGRRPRLNKN